MGIMPHYATWDRAPYHPYECVVCTHQASTDNPLVDAGRVIEDYGDVYICRSCVTSIAYYLNIVQDAQAIMEKKIEELNEQVGKVPALIERLVNGIRDLSISTSADLLAIGTPVILADDKDAEQSDISIDENELGNDSVTESVSESVVDEGPDSLPASPSSKRAIKAGTRNSSANNG